MDVSFQKDASLHVEVLSEEVCCFEGHDGSCQGKPINGWELKQKKCDSWNNMWRSIRRGVKWSLTWREFEVH